MIDRFPIDNLSTNLLLRRLARSVFVATLVVCLGAEYALSESPPREPPYTDTETPIEEQKSAEPNPTQPDSVATKEVSREPSPEEERQASENQVQKVKRPEASEKGLVLIDKQGQYFYRVTPSVQKNAASVMLGSFNPTQIKSERGENIYKTVYGGGSATVLLATWEYQFLKTAIGKLGFRAGTGAIVAQGNGRFSSGYGENAAKTPRERFTLIGLPNNADFVYRMQFWDKQPLIPYGFGGGDYFMFMETRNDKRPNRYMGALAAHAGAGVCFSFNWIDKLNMSRLDQEYGINNIMLSAELRQVVGLKSDFDVTSTIYAFGITADY